MGNFFTHDWQPVVFLQRARQSAWFAMEVSVFRGVGAAEVEGPVGALPHTSRLAAFCPPF